MRATFLGFEIAKKALVASQKGLDVVSQNISNVNTEGYTRQKVNLSAATPDNGAYFYSNPTTADIGMGVDVAGISQIRDQILDYKYRKENAINNTWNKSLDGLKNIEDILDEYSTSGLNKQLENFYDKLQTFSSNTSSIEYAGLLRTSAQTVAQVLNKYSEQLNVNKEIQKEDLSIVVTDLNELVTKISKMNDAIKGALLSGYSPNELLDTRNSYLDKLSGYVNIAVENKEDGTLAIKSGSTYLLDENQQINQLSFNSTDPATVYNSDGSEFVSSNGEVFAHLQILNGKGVYASSTENSFKGIPYYQQSLDFFAQKFAETYNNLNAVNGVSKPLFEGDSSGNITASNIKISQAWLMDSMYITSTTGATTVIGANDNINRMIQAMDADYTFSSAFSGSFEEYVTALNGEIAMSVEYYTDMAETSDTIMNSVSEQRESVSGVSLDEESVNMIKFQKAYSAAARVITTMDEMLNILINNMGIVGR